MIDYLLLMILVLLQTYDIYSTNAGLKMGKIEYFPIMRWIMDKMGVLPGLIVSKSIYLIFALCVLILYPGTVYVTIALAIAILFSATICYNNFKVLKSK